MPQGPRETRQLGLYMALAQIGTEMAVPIAAGVFLDYYLAWPIPWGAIGGALLGLTGGLVHLIALLNRQAKNGPDSQDQNLP